MTTSTIGLQARARVDVESNAGNNGFVVRGMFLALLLCSIACHHKTEYLVQAAGGQLRLSLTGVPVEHAALDESLPRYVRELMAEVPHVRKFAESQGLSVSSNYTRYVHIRSRAVVWFVGAAPEFSLDPVTWHFPIVGSFPGLGFFTYKEALDWRNRLAREGYDTQIRAVPAFSTGGWFTDPVVTPMLRQGANRFGSLTNVLIHESVHATILINSQSFFNESVASYIGDRMSTAYLAQRFGADADYTKRYNRTEKRYTGRVNRMGETYEALKKLYASKLPKAEMRAQKKQLLDKLDRDLRLWYRPNNATLSGNKTYQSGKTGFDELFSACGSDWKRFIAALKRLKESDFPKKQTDKLEPVLIKLAQRECRAKKSN